MAEKMTWDDELDETEAVEQQKENDFVLLPDGEYDFTIKKFEKDFYTAKPDAKVQSCPVAKISLLIKDDEGNAAYVKESLFLHAGNKWQLFAFFTCLGLRKHGDGTKKMPWDKVEGASGRCRLGTRKYTQNGETKTVNTVKRWLDPAAEAEASGGDEDDYE